MKEARQSQSLGIEVGDKIFTDCGSYIVGEVVTDRSQPMYLPQGWDEFTYLIPHENVVRVDKRNT